jgi:hypothetical protein
MAKSTRPIIRIHNSETNEVIDREMTDDEFAKYEACKELENQRQAEIEAKATARQVIADRLGLTADELKLLLG